MQSCLRLPGLANELVAHNPRWGALGLFAQAIERGAFFENASLHGATLIAEEGGSAIGVLITDSCRRRCGDGVSMELRKFKRWSILLTCQKKLTAVSELGHSRIQIRTTAIKTDNTSPAPGPFSFDTQVPLERHMTACSVRTHQRASSSHAGAIAVSPADRLWPRESRPRAGWRPIAAGRQVSRSTL
jgi:hypothetical protein